MAASPRKPVLNDGGQKTLATLMGSHGKRLDAHDSRMDAHEATLGDHHNRLTALEKAAASQAADDAEPDQDGSPTGGS